MLSANRKIWGIFKEGRALRQIEELEVYGLADCDQDMTLKSNGKRSL
jgi:hypothetical protein